MAEEYLDDIILKKKQKKKKEKLLHYVQAQQIVPNDLFQTLRIGDDMAEIRLPMGLNPMSETMISRKYQYDPQPQVVMASKEGDISFAFSVLEVTITGKELASNVGKIREGLSIFWPSAVFYETGQDEVNGIKVSWFSYMNNSLDGCKLYHMIYYAATEKTLIISMSCKYDQMEEWSTVARFCLRSLKGKACNE